MAFDEALSRLGFSRSSERAPRGVRTFTAQPNPYLIYTVQAFEDGTALFTWEFAVGEYLLTKGIQFGSDETLNQLAFPPPHSPAGSPVISRRLLPYRVLGAPLQVPSGDITVAVIPPPRAISRRAAWNSSATSSETGCAAPLWSEWRSREPNSETAEISRSMTAHARQ